MTEIETKPEATATDMFGDSVNVEVCEFADHPQIGDAIGVALSGEHFPMVFSADEARTLAGALLQSARMAEAVRLDRITLECSDHPDATPIIGHGSYSYIRTEDELPVSSDAPLDELIAKVKLFHPDGPGTYWIYAYDPKTRIVEVVARLGDHPAELGSMHMDQIISARGVLDLPFERDELFMPTKVTEILRSTESA